MSEQNKTVVRRLFDELWNKGNLPVADEFFAPTYEHHDASTPDVGPGPESGMYHVIDLPCEVDPSKAKATFNDGRLDVVLPKVALAKSARV
jgi:predicted SnoaL-like aldol condensation-catalyzing enzyme